MTHAFCPRFTYFEIVLGIDQKEGKRGTIQSGRAYHSRHSTTNKTYKIKNIQGKKHIELLLYSKKHSFSGKIDEAIETENEILLIERKYSDHILLEPSVKTQLGLLAILAEENIGKKVNNALMIFDKKERIEIPIKITKKIKQQALLMLQKTNHTINSGNIPYSKHDNRCTNCCYRKICP